jgi:hypothetical protein
VIVTLAVVGAALHTGLRIPDDDDARTGQQRPMREIRSDPAFGVALLAATVGYTIMILVMTATPSPWGRSSPGRCCTPPAGRR